MKMGEYFVEKNYITRETLDEALKFQRCYKDQRIGEILVNMRKVSKKNMINYVSDYIEANVGDTESWLVQKEVDELLLTWTSQNQKNL